MTRTAGSALRAPTTAEQPGPWINQGTCRAPDVDPDWWSEAQHQGLARHICRSHCPVRAECAQWARTTSWHGNVVGGELRHKGGTPSTWQPVITRAGCPRCGIPMATPTRKEMPPPRPCGECGRTVGCHPDGQLSPHHTAPQGGHPCPGDGSTR